MSGRLKSIMYPARYSPVQSAIVLLAVLTVTDGARAQDLEPRALSNVPVGMNFVLIGYGFASGNVLLDPALPVEGVESQVNTIVGTYVRTLDVGGLSGKLDVVVPFAGGDWAGVLEGEQATRLATGFGDPRVRLSVNFAGAPALRASEFADYRQRTVVGASIQVGIPVGQYDPDRLLNIGANRWFFKPQVGVSHTVGAWTVEGYGSTWLFTRNDNFFGGRELELRPLWAVTTHLVRSLPRGMWVAGDLGYGAGGRAIVNGERRESSISNVRFGLTAAIPLRPGHAVRASVATAVRGEFGPEFTGFGVSYQYRWGG